MRGAYMWRAHGRLTTIGRIERVIENVGDVRNPQLSLEAAGGYA